MNNALSPRERTDLNCKLRQLKGWNSLSPEDQEWGRQAAVVICRLLPELKVGLGDRCKPTTHDEGMYKALVFSVSDDPACQKDRRLALRLDQDSGIGLPKVDKRRQIHLRITVKHLETLAVTSPEVGKHWTHRVIAPDQRAIEAWLRSVSKRLLQIERPDRTEEIEVRGGGFGDAETRKAVEKAAVDHVIAALKANGFDIEDRQAENCGFDLLATGNGKRLEVEVKGTSEMARIFFITRNERQRAKASADWRLYLVSNALGEKPLLHEYTWPELETAFDMNALAWRCQFKPS
ncbi:MAG: hypothetical protein CFE41_07100 [Burkholderiales bacterium PBB2]|nr:MAG: hypothetical protein CFE41_07100 [Burkholderiales bacterium PBB2]